MNLGASNYTYAEAIRTQKLVDFVGSTTRAFEHFGGVAEVVVPDQLRSAVSGPDRYEPDINPTYLEMAQHYGVTVTPARPRNWAQMPSTTALSPMLASSTCAESMRLSLDPSLRGSRSMPPALLGTRSIFCTGVSPFK